MAIKRPYAEYDEQSLILRDWLAADRTVLANERTFLAYARTALGCLITGISLMKLFEDVWVAELSGWAMIVVSGIVFVAGLTRFIRVSRMLRRIGANRPAPESQN